MRRSRPCGLALLVLLAACAGPQARRDVDPALQDVALRVPDARIAMRYATADNFVGTVIDGYHARRCLLTAPAASALADVQTELRAFGLSLILYDCYRPQRAVDHFLRWSRDPADTRMRERYYPREDKGTLFARGYIAERSGHSRGSTVDLGLVDSQGVELDMGTGWDFMDPLSATESSGIPDPARRNRLLLRAVMERHGCLNYTQEWWHFTLRDEPWPTRYFDREIR